MIEPKKILLLGDSNFRGEWAVADKSVNWNPYWGDRIKSINKYIHNPKKMYQVAHPGLEHWLSEQGHLVINGSFAGGSNFCALKVLTENLFMTNTTWNTLFSVPDVVVICLTEPLRELYRYFPNLPDSQGYWDNIIMPLCEKAETPEELNAFLLKTFFDILQEIYNVTKVPIILVEGWGKDLGLLKNYTFCKHIHKKWLEGIIKIKPPMICTMQTYEATVKFFGDKLKTNKRDRLLKHYERFHSKLGKTRIFPDGGHPSYEHHRALSKKLLPIINKIPKKELPVIDYKEYNSKFRPVL